MPRHSPRLSGVPKPAELGVTPQTSDPRARIAATVSFAGWARAGSERSAAIPAARIVLSMTVSSEAAAGSRRRWAILARSGPVSQGAGPTSHASAAGDHSHSIVPGGLLV